MTEITFADISEFQANFDANPYLAAGHRVIICRVHNGYRPDKMMPGRLHYLRQQKFTAVGLYQYVVKDRDPGLQAHEFCSLIGRLLPNEFPVGDFEEGSGPQTVRAQRWFDVVDKWAGFQSSLYTGSSFMRDQLSGTAHWGRRPVWIASYPVTYSPAQVFEPPGCTWWQYSDREHFPGLAGGVDASVYRGTADSFLSRVRAGAHAGAGVAAPPPAVRDMAVVRDQVFVQLTSGEIKHHVVGTTWQSLGKPGQ